MTSKERAEQLKNKGNECFQKAKYNAAIDMYTEAICLDPTQSTYFSNRALCHIKLQNWYSAKDDCVHAQKLDPLNAKANYLLGMSCTNLHCYDEAVKAYMNALNVAEKANKPKAFLQEITTELRRTKKKQWHALQEQNIYKHETFKHRLNQVFESAGAPDKEMDALVAYVDHMAAKLEDSFYAQEIPEYFVCPVSMEIMHDPVCTPNGVSYERACIEEHLRKNGPVDPLTRQRLTLEMLRPNNSLRAAIHDFLERNPWAFET